MSNELRARVATFVRTTCGNVLALVQATDSPSFDDSHAESVEAVAECMGMIFERSAATLRKMVLPVPPRETE